MGRSASSLVTAMLLVSIGVHAPSAKPAAVRSVKTDTNNVSMMPQALRLPLPNNDQVADTEVDCHQQACVALTFDDGPNPLTTPVVLAELQQSGAKATFFVVGSRVPANATLLRQMHQAGMEIANHSWSHPNFSKLTPEQIHQQVDQTQAAIAATGLPAPKYFRPPYEVVNPIITTNVPMPFVLWNVDPKDWTETDPAKLIATIDAQVKPGSVIIMHDIWNSTAQALPPILDHLKTKYQLVTVSQLLKLPDGARGIYSHQ